MSRADAHLEAESAPGGPAVAEALLGVEGRYVLAYNGPPLRARAVGDDSPALVRIADVGREAGGATLYDLRFIGVREGTHDLASYLETTAGSPVENLPALRVHVRSTLPPGHQGQLEIVAGVPAPRLGGYWLLIGALIAVWIVPAAVAIARARRRTATPAPPPPESAEESPEQALRALVRQALQGASDAAALARLERHILAHWRDRLGMRGSAMNDALRAMRRDAEAAPAIEMIERWLHAPPGAQRSVAPAQALARYAEAPAALASSEGAP